MGTHGPIQSEKSLPPVDNTQWQKTRSGHLQLGLAYALAATLPVGALLVRLSLGFSIGDRPGLMFYLLPIILTAYLGGLGPGLLCTLVATVVSKYCLLPPLHILVTERALDGAQWSALILGGILVSVVSEALHRARGRAEKSQRLLAVTLDSIADGVITTDVIGRVTFLNPQAQRLTGWAEAEARGKPIEEVFPIVHEDTLERAETISKTVVAAETGAGFVNHSLLTSKDGTTRPIVRKGSPIRDESSRVIGYVLVFSDQTQERAAQKALVQSEERYRALFERARDAIMFIDIGAEDPGRIVAANQVAAEMHGYELPELLSLNISHLIISEHREKISELRRRILKGEWLREQLRHRRKDGTVFYIGMSAGLLELGDRKLALEIARDITERRRGEELLRTRLALSEYAAGHTLDELLRETIDRAELLTGSQIGFLHFVEDDQTTIALQTWSTNTLNNICTAPGKGLHYPIDAAGVWADCVRLRRPIIHEDLETLPNRKGMPAGHAPVQRELVVPVFRGDLIVAILGVGNKPANYNDADIQIISQLANMAWDIVTRKRSEEALRRSEEKYRDLFDNSSDLIYTHDIEGNLTSVNAACTALLGYGKKELLNMNLSHLVDPEHLGRAERYFRRRAAREPGKGERHEMLVRAKDGRPVWLEVNSRFIMGEDGTRVVHGNARDITDRKMAEAERSRLVTAIEQAGEAMIITDPHGTIQYVNPAFEQVSGYARTEVIGKTPRILRSAAHEPTFYRKIWDTISAGHVWRGNLINKKKDGTLFEEKVTISPVKDEQGGIANFVAVKRDVTNEALLQKQLLEAQKMEAIGTLAGGIAHDFNNLLQVINGYTELALFEIKEGDRGYSALQQIKQAGHSAAELTQGLLMFSRRVESKLRPVELNHELRNLAKMLTRTIPKMIEIRMDLSDDLDAINADPAQVQQIIINLVVNSRDAMPDGGRLVIETRNILLDEDYCHAHLGTEPGHYVLLSVSDTGHGMDYPTRRQAFDPFFTTKEPGQGTGLGLSIVFGIVKSHGGNILCYSEPGQGTTFKVYLPALTAARHTEKPDSSSPLVGGNETILLVDDEEAVRGLAELTLTKFGYSVLTAPDGKEGLATYCARQQEIDLVILDLIMPELGGKLCLTEILRINPAAKVIIASGYSANGKIDEARQLGAMATISKPYEARQLLDTLRKVLDNVQPGEDPDKAQ